MDWAKRTKLSGKTYRTWQQSFFEYEATDLENSYDKWVDQSIGLLPETIQVQFFEKVDSLLFHLNSLLRGSQLQSDASERILHAARSINVDIDTLADMRKMPIDQLTFLAEQQIARQQTYSLIQGGMTGLRQALLIGSRFSCHACHQFTCRSANRYVFRARSSVSIGPTGNIKGT